VGPHLGPTFLGIRIWASSLGPQFGTLQGGGVINHMPGLVGTHLPFVDPQVLFGGAIAYRAYLPPADMCGEYNMGIGNHWVPTRG